MKGKSTINPEFLATGSQQYYQERDNEIRHNRISSELTKQFSNQNFEKPSSKLFNTDSKTIKERLSSSKTKNQFNNYRPVSLYDKNKLGISTTQSSGSESFQKVDEPKIGKSNQNKFLEDSYKVSSFSLGLPLSVELSILKIENQNYKKQAAKNKQTIQKLRNQLSEKVSMLQKFNKLMKVKYSQIKQLQSSCNLKQATIISLQSRIQQILIEKNEEKLKKQLFKKTMELDNLKAKIDGLDHDIFKNQPYQLKIAKLHEELDQQRSKSVTSFLLISELNNKVKSLQQQLQLLNLDSESSSIIGKTQQSQQANEKLFISIQSSTSIKSGRTSGSHLSAFDEALKVQMKQISELKGSISNYQQLIQKLRDNLLHSRKQLESLRGQMRIWQVKSESERKKLIVEYRLQLHEKDNQLSSFQKHSRTQEQKHQHLSSELREKDSFIKQYLAGRASTEQMKDLVEQVLKAYSERFDNIQELKIENQTLKLKLDKYHQYEIC